MKSNIATVNGKSFTGLNFCGFCGLSEKRKSFSMNLCSKYKHILLPGLVPRKYYRENPYTEDNAKVSLFMVTKLFFHKP